MKKLNTGQAIAVVVGIALVAYLIYGGSLLSIFSGDVANQEEMELPETGVTVEDVIEGDGVVANAGDAVVVHYVGTLTNGQVFDSSVDRGTPFVFTLGVGQVIQGWDEGVVGMKIGGKRRLVIAPDYAYGDQGVGAVPPNSTLIFEVELLDVGKPNTEAAN